jgi:hypothetical protein
MDYCWRAANKAAFLMAYLCTNFAAADHRADHTAMIAAPAAGGFSPREWTVVTLARKDRAPATKPPSRWQRLIHSVFGIPVANPLADERLELLRVAASRLWRGHAGLDDELLLNLIRHGYSVEQLGLLRAFIRRSRTPA